jgi:hypothetical protein
MLTALRLWQAAVVSSVLQEAGLLPARWLLQATQLMTVQWLQQQM